jgi:hypothetical protein
MVVLVKTVKEENFLTSSMELHFPKMFTRKVKVLSNQHSMWEQ